MYNRLDIMLAFISPVTRADIQVYHEITEGTIQTNEAGILYVQQELLKQGHSLDAVYCLSTMTVLKENLSEKRSYLLNDEKVKEIGDVTHLNFLRARMTYHDDFWENKLKEIPCEDLDPNSPEGSAQILADISNITESVVELKHNNNIAQVVVHCDITGGFRHGAAMLMVILQLLKYHKCRYWNGYIH